MFNDVPPPKQDPSDAALREAQEIRHDLAMIQGTLTEVLAAVRNLQERIENQLCG